MKSYKKPFIIAEIGCNHKGDLELAKKMIQIAKNDCEVDCVKFQKRNNKELLSHEDFNKPHPNPANSYGATYGEHREFLEFSIDDHMKLYDHCNSLNVIYSTSVWDLTSAKEVTEINPKLIKIPSACNNNLEMLSWLSDNYDGEIHISTGMSTESEIKNAVSIFSDKNNVILYNCVSGYPVPFSDLNLLEINRLYERYKDAVKGIGFSGHHLGIAIDIAAFALGACYIERHFTLDRTWKGTDHSASLEPQGMKKLVRDLNATYDSLKLKECEILPIEKEQREKLKYKKE